MLDVKEQGKTEPTSIKVGTGPAMRYISTCQARLRRYGFVEFSGLGLAVATVARISIYLARQGYPNVSMVLTAVEKDGRRYNPNNPKAAEMKDFIATGQISVIPLLTMKHTQPTTKPEPPTS
jgi:hypothetical protein